MAAVITVPKTVPTAAIRNAFGADIPAGGSQDLLTIIADSPESGLTLPLLFIDAVNIVDPATVAALLAENPTSFI